MKDTRLRPDPSGPTQLDFKAADDLIAHAGPPGRPVEEARTALAEQCHRLGESMFRLINGLRPPANCREELVLARAWQQITREEFARKLREQPDQYLTEEILDLRFNELQRNVGVYCDFIRLCWAAVREPHAVDGYELEKELDAICEKLSEKSQFSKEELELISGFVAEARIHHQAGGVQLKTFSAGSCSAVAMIAAGKMTQVWRDRQQDEYRSPILDLCQACIDALPRPQDLSTMLEQEHALARLYLRQRQPKAAESQPISAQQVTFAVQANTVAFGVEANKEDDNVAAAEDQAKLKVDRWSELAIGIDENGCWALTPRPEFGERFKLSNAIRLPLKSERWMTLFQRLANSSDGETVLRKHLIEDWKLLPAEASDLASNLDALDPDERSKLSSLAGTTRAALNRVLTELRERLRELIDGPKGPANTCLETQGDFVRAGFRVAHLLANPEGGFRFGDRRPVS